MDGACHKYEVKHISYDKVDGIKFLNRLSNSISLFNAGYGYICEDDVHKICELDQCYIIILKYSY